MEENMILLCYLAMFNRMHIQCATTYILIMKLVPHNACENVGMSNSTRQCPFAAFERTIFLFLSILLLGSGFHRFFAPFSAKTELKPSSILTYARAFTHVQYFVWGGKGRGAILLNGNRNVTERTLSQIDMVDHALKRRHQSTCGILHN